MPKLPEAQPQCLPRAPSPRVLLECPTPEYLYQERVGMFEAKYFLTHVTMNTQEDKEKRSFWTGKEGRMDCFCSWQEGRPLSAPTPSLLLSFSPALPGFLFFVLRKFKGTAKKRGRRFPCPFSLPLLFSFLIQRERKRLQGENNKEWTKVGRSFPCPLSLPLLSSFLVQRERKRL